MISRLAFALAVCGLVSACGTSGLVDESFRLRPPKKPPQALLVVTVVNGDTDARVRGATVRIGPHLARTNGRGEAEIRVRRRAPLMVGVTAKGYTPKRLRMPFQKRRKVTVRIYDPKLQWRMYGANPRRTQAHTAIRLRPPFRQVWSRGVGSLVEFPAVVSDGVAYVTNFRGRVYAIEMRRGKVVWTFTPRGGKSASSPAVVDRRRLVVHGMDGIVRVLDRQNGRQLWHVRIGSPIESSPVVRGGVDYFGAWNGNVYALDLRTRKLRWVHRSGYKITSSAALKDGTLYIGDYGGRLLALAARTGRLRWARSVNGRIYGTPAVAAGRVLVPSSTGGSLTAFSTGGRYLWRVSTGAYVYSSPAVWAGRAYFGSYNGRLYAVSLRTGRVAWSVGAGGPVSGAVVVVGGVAYAGSTRGGIVGADGKTGRILVRFPHGEYVPVSGNGRRLLFHGYSRIYAVEPR